MRLAERDFPFSRDVPLVGASLEACLQEWDGGALDDSGTHISILLPRTSCNIDSQTTPRTHHEIVPLAKCWKRDRATGFRMNLSWYLQRQQQQQHRQQCDGCTASTESTCFLGGGGLCSTSLIVQNAPYDWKAGAHQLVEQRAQQRAEQGSVSRWVERFPPLWQTMSSLSFIEADTVGCPKYRLESRDAALQFSSCCYYGSEQPTADEERSFKSRAISHLGETERILAMSIAASSDDSKRNIGTSSFSRQSQSVQKTVNGQTTADESSSHLPFSQKLTGEPLHTSSSLWGPFPSKTLLSQSKSEFPDYYEREFESGPMPWCSQGGLESRGSATFLRDSRRISTMGTLGPNGSAEMKLLTYGSVAKTLKGSGTFEKSGLLDLQRKAKMTAVLTTLLVARGQQRRVFLTPTELVHMNVLSLDEFLFRLKQQTLKGRPCVHRLFQGTCAAFTLAICGVILCIIGSLSWLFTKSYIEWRGPYSVGVQNVKVSLNHLSGWDAQKPVYVYAAIENFHAFHRSYRGSRPVELFPGYSCGVETTVGALKRVRSPESLPEFPALAFLPDTQNIYPCGLSSFALFNDRFGLYRERDHQPITLDTVNISGRQHFILYASLKRPFGLTIHDDWIKPTFPMYRNWMFLNPGRYSLVLLAIIRNGLPRDTYIINFTQNG